MPATGQTQHFLVTVGDDGTVIAQRISWDDAGVSRTGAASIGYTGPDVQSKAHAVRFAVGSLLAFPSATGQVGEPSAGQGSPASPSRTRNSSRVRQAEQTANQR